VIERVNLEATRALRIPEVARRLEDVGAAPAMGTPEDFAFLPARRAGPLGSEVVRVSGAIRADD
jgi:hypothetical protein